MNPIYFQKSFLFLAITFLLAMVMTSCAPEDDDNPSPEGRNKFIGEWNVIDGCDKGNYIVDITEDNSNTAQVLLYNFANSNASEPDTAIVAGNSIVLYTQMNSEGWRVSGTGDYSVEGKIEWVFNLTISGSEDFCTATYSR